MTADPYLIWGLPWQLVTSIGSIGAAFSAVFMGQITKYWLDRKRDKEVRNDEETAQLILLRAILVQQHLNWSAFQQFDLSQSPNGRITEVLDHYLKNPFSSREDMKSIRGIDIIGSYSGLLAAWESCERNTFKERARNEIATTEDIVAFNKTVTILLNSLVLLENRISQRLKLPTPLKRNEHSIKIN